MPYTHQCSKAHVYYTTCFGNNDTLPQAATTGASIFEQPPNAMAQAKQEIGQSQQFQDFALFAHLLVRSGLTTIYLQTT